MVIIIKLTYRFWTNLNFNGKMWASPSRFPFFAEFQISIHFRLYCINCRPQFHFTNSPFHLSQNQFPLILLLALPKSPRFHRINPLKVLILFIFHARKFTVLDWKWSGWTSHSGIDVVFVFPVAQMLDS